ncbi:MAG TPA: hypothetical protein VMV87_08175 [Burkholderiales bacterium]|nr:hypothetical protein [Burkholderiales bacterium]
MFALATGLGVSVAAQGAVPQRKPANILRVTAKKNDRAPAAVRALWHVCGSGQK